MKWLNTYCFSLDEIHSLKAGMRLFELVFDREIWNSMQIAATGVCQERSSIKETLLPKWSECHWWMNVSSMQLANVRLDVEFIG